MVGALLDQIRRPEIGEHGDAEKLERAVAASAHRGVERLAVERVHGEKLGAGARDRRGGALDRRLDVEQLRVDEHSAPARRELVASAKPPANISSSPIL